MWTFRYKNTKKKGNVLILNTLSIFLFLFFVKLGGKNGNLGDSAYGMLGKKGIYFILIHFFFIDN